MNANLVRNQMNVASLARLFAALALAAALVPLTPARAAASAQSATVPPPPGLVSWWPGDGNALDIADGNHGTAMNGTTFAAGNVDQAFSLLGTADYIRVPDSVNLNIVSDLTLEAWISLPDVILGGDRAIIDKRTDNDSLATYSFFIEGDSPYQGTANRPLAFVMRSPTFSVNFSSVLNWQSNRWYHVAVTRSGSTVTFYRDGLAVGIGTASVSAVATPGARLAIGAVPLSSGVVMALRGLIDETSIYSRALTAAEIQSIFNAGSAGKHKAVVALWINSNASDQILRYDGRTGTFVGAAASGGSGLDGPAYSIIGPDGKLYIGSGHSDSILRFDPSSGAFLGAFVSAGSSGLDYPHGSDFGSDGHFYVSSYLSNKVLRYNGSTGAFVDAFVSSVGRPTDLEFGPDGNLYVASDTTRQVLRYNGTTGAAIGVYASGGGLVHPTGITFGPDGNLYVADYDNHRVQRFQGPGGASPGASMGVFASGGGLNYPQEVTFGPDGHLYVSSFTTHSIKRYNGTSGAFIDTFIVAGSGGLNMPTGLVFFSEPTAPPPDTTPPTVANLNSSADTGDGELREGEYTALGITQLHVTFSEAMQSATATTPTNYALAGTSGAITVDSVTYDSGTKAATLNLNGGAALPPDDYTLTVSGAGLEDLAGNQLDGNGNGTGGDDFTRHFTVSSTAPTLLVSSYSSQLLQYDGATGAFVGVFAPYNPLRNPNGITFGPRGDVYVSNMDGDNVLRYDGETGDFTTVFASGNGLTGPFGLAFGPDGNLYVADFDHHNVLRYDGATGVFMDEFVASQSGGMVYAAGLAFGPDENLYVASYATDQVLRFDKTTGAFMNIFASGNGLDGPIGVIFGPDGNLYVASQNNDRIVRYDGATGAFIDTFVAGGSGGLSGAGYLVFGPDRNLYISSWNNNSVKRYHGETGAYLGDFVAAGSGGLLGPTGLAFSPATAAPPVCPAVLPALDENLISVSPPLGGAVTVTGEAGAVWSFTAPNTVVEVTNRRTGVTVSAPVAPDGSFSASIAAREDDLLDVVAVDDSGGPCQASSTTVSVVVILPTVTITSPASGATFNTANVEVSFSVAEWVVGGKDETHIQFTLDGGADSLMFYNGADQVVELNDAPGPTPLATWVDANTIRLNSLADGTHTLRAELVDADHAPPGNPEADVTITIHVDTTAPSFVDQTLNYDADTLTLSDSGELDETGTVTLVVKDNGTGGVVASETVSTAATPPYTYSLSLTLADPPPAIIRVEKSARDGAGNETPGPALLLDTSVSAVSGLAGVTLPGSGTQIGTTGDVVGVTGTVTDGRPTAAVTAGSSGGAVGIAYTLSPSQDLSLCGPAGACVVTLGGAPLPTTRTVLPNGYVQYSADTTLAPGETANTGLGFDPAQGGAGVASATDPNTGAVAETSGDVAQTTISADGDGMPVGAVTAGSAGGTITISFTLSAARDLTLCGVLGACRIFEGSTPLDTARTVLPDGRVRYSVTASFTPGQIKLYSLKRFDTQAPVLIASAILASVDGASGQAQVTGLAGAASDESAPVTVRVMNTRTGGSVSATAAGDGSFSASIAAQSGDTLEITATDGVGSTGAALQLAVYDAAALAMTLAGSLDGLGAIEDVVIAGRYAIVVTEHGCFIVDIGDPNAPRLVGQVHRSSAPEVGNATSVYVSGNIIYLTSAYGLVIIDWGDPENPRVIGTMQATGARGVAVREQRAYVLYSGGLQVIDLGSGGGPTVITTITSVTFGGQVIDLTGGGGSGARRIYVQGDTLIVVHEDCGCVALFNLADPDNPTIFNLITAEPQPRDAVLIGGTLIIGGGGGITVVNVGGGGGGGTVAQTLTGGAGGSVLIEDVIALWGGGSLIVGSAPGGIFILRFDVISGTVEVIGARGMSGAGEVIIRGGQVLVLWCGCTPTALPSLSELTLAPDVEPPTVESITATPRLARDGEAIVIEATIHDHGGVADANCGITLPDGRRITLPMSPVPDQPGKWQAVYPISPDDPSGNYEIEIETGDFGGNRTTAPGDPVTVDNEKPGIGDSGTDGPRLSDGTPVAQPGECVEPWAFVTDMVSGVESVEAVITRPDGSEVIMPLEVAGDRYRGQFCVGGDDPGGRYRIKIRAKDAAGNGAEKECGCHDFIVNHPPEIEIGPDKVSNEGDTVSFNAALDDPDPDESHTVIWDFGDGTTASGTLAPTRVYGDNGVFTVTAVVTDRYGAQGGDALTVTVSNLNPALALDTSGATVFAGGAAFTGRVGVEQTHQASASDPGSDDLTFNWNSGAARTAFNNGASADALSSPAGNFPFAAADEAKFNFTAPGLYTVSVTAADDDGGQASASLTKLVMGASGCARSQGFWKKQFSLKGQHHLDDPTLAAYLGLVNFTSSVFSEQAALSTLEDARLMMETSDSDKRLKARTQLLAAWLNFAQGSVGWDEVIQGEDDIGPMPFNQAMAQAEAILLNPDATHAELERAKNLAEAVNHLDENNGACGDDGHEDDDADDGPDAHDGDDQDKGKDKKKDDDKGEGKGK